MRRVSPFAAAIVLALVAGSGGIVAPEPIVASDDGLILAASTRYDLIPEQRVVRVTVDAAATSVTPDTATHQIFYTSITLPAPPAAQSISATAGGGAIGAGVVEATEDYTAIEVTFSQGIFYQQTYRFRLTFDLPELGGAPGREVRVGSSFAAFPVWAFGSPGAPSSIEVALPDQYEATLLAGDLEEQRLAGGTTLLTATGIADPDAFFAYVTAERPGARERQELTVEVGGTPARIVLLGWEDDPDWLERTRPLIEEGLPLLGEAIGLGYPIVGPLRVSEHAFGRLGDYAGTFDPVTDAIEIRYDADAFVGLHEAAHVWFNGALFAERWIGEAFASYYAEVVGGQLGLELEIFALTPELRGAAFPLNDWESPGREDRARDEYAYPATLEVAREIAALAGADGLREIWAAADGSLVAYQPRDPSAGEKGVPSSVEGWMRLLDLLEERTGADYDPIWIDWIVTDGQAARLADREEARIAYAAAITSSDDWELPRSLRLLMESWRFDDALGVIVELEAVLDDRAEIEARAARLSLEPPGTLRRAFESGGPEPASREATAQLAALEALVQADSRLSRPLAPVEVVGLLGEPDPAVVLVDAGEAFEDGDADGAIERASAAVEARLAAREQGTLRVVVGGGLLLLIDGAAMAGLLARRRRRAHPPPQPSVIG